ncbi:Uncharacterised protein [Moraxella equi]|uniref:Uncharacterized protein n=1 Tax=Moraxella equi TaxID=60442 RepID=A0A378QPK8_9GAMM|nr:Uncharacterised protein [Moraxella equi]
MFLHEKWLNLVFHRKYKDSTRHIKPHFLDEKN